MIKAVYEFIVDEKFEKGMCSKCKLSHEIGDIGTGTFIACKVREEYGRCPLKIIDDKLEYRNPVDSLGNDATDFSRCF